jgi:hypothetical protein
MPMKKTVDVRRKTFDKVTNQSINLQHDSQILPVYQQILISDNS